MVKGVCRRVIVVRSPDTKLFEQAIFLLREDAPGISDAQVLRQACQAADDYVSRRAQGAKRPAADAGGALHVCFWGRWSRGFAGR